MKNKYRSRLSTDVNKLFLLVLVTMLLSSYILMDTAVFETNQYSASLFDSFLVNYFKSSSQTSKPVLSNAKKSVQHKSTIKSRTSTSNNY